MVRPKGKPLHRYFYWNGEVHKVLRTIRPQNLVEAWNFPQRMSVSILYTDYRRDATKAYSVSAAAAMLNVEKKVLKRGVDDGTFERPQRIYPLDGKFTPGEHRWSEADILEVHEALLQRHRGRPRKDGKITPNPNLPSRAELLAKLRGDQVLYAKTEDGRLVPVFEAQRW